MRVMHLKSSTFMGIVFAIGVQTALAAEDTVVLQTHINPPYQVMGKEGLQGESLEKLACIFAKMERPYAITVAPRKRNRVLTKEGRIDGFFLSVPDHSLDQFSSPTDPLALERWNLYQLTSTDREFSKEIDEIAAVHGSNEEIWLHQNGYVVSGTIKDTLSLIRMLDTQRIKYALVDENSFAKAFDEHVIHGSFRRTFVKYVPLMVYFSNKFLEENEGFIRSFNLAARHCVEDHAQTNEFEQMSLSQKAKAVLDEIVSGNLAQLAKRLSSKPSLSFKARINQDVEWQKAIENETKTAIMEQVLENDLSEKLREVVAGSQAMISEVFIFDERGFTLAMNDVTSDYWQGDEAAYQALFKEGEGIHFSAIEFDQSARKYQVQVSLPILSPESHTPIAGITIGFDVEKTLSANLGF